MSTDKMRVYDDTERLDFVLANSAFTAPSCNDSIELMVQDEDENFHTIGVGSTDRHAIDSAMTEIDDSGFSTVDDYLVWKLK